MTTFGFCKGCPLLEAGCVRGLQDDWVLRNDLPCRLLPTTEAGAAELARRKAEAWRAAWDEVVFVLFFGGFGALYIAGLTLILMVAFGGWQ